MSEKKKGEDKKAKKKEVSLDEMYEEVVQTENNHFATIQKNLHQSKQMRKFIEKQEQDIENMEEEIGDDDTDEDEDEDIFENLSHTLLTLSFINHTILQLTQFENHRARYSKALREYTKAIQDKQEKLQKRQEQQDNERHKTTIYLTIGGLLLAVAIVFISPLIAKLYEMLSTLEIIMLICTVVFLCITLLYKALGILK